MPPAYSILAAVLFCSGLYPAFSQFAFSPVHHLQASDGLPAGAVGFMLRDKSGYMWIGSMGGICRFDGTRVKVYPERGNKRHAHMDGLNVQGPILEDARGNIWFCTIEAVHRIDAATDEISVFHLRDAKGRPLRTDYHLFYLEADRYLWIRQGDSLYILDILTNRQYAILKSFPYLWAKIAAGKNGDLKYLVGYRPNNTEGVVFYRMNHRAAPTDSQRLGPPKYFDHALTGLTRGMVQTSADSFWFCNDKGALLIRPESGLTKQFAYDPRASAIGFHAIAHLPDGKFALSTKGHGIYLLDPVSGDYSGPFRQDLCDPASLSSDSFFSLYTDPGGILWLGHWSGGLDYVDLNVPKFKPLTADLPAYIQKGSELKFLQEDALSNIWMANTAGEIAAYDAIEQEFLDLSFINRALSARHNIEIRFMGAGKHGDIWIATLDEVYRIAPMGSQIRKVYQCPENVLVLAANIAAGRLYISLSDRSLQQIDIRRDKDRYPASPVRKDELREHNYLFSDPLSGDLFCGMGTSRLDHCRISTSGEPEVLRSLHEGLYIAKICYDPLSGLHWLATEKGLYYLPAKAQKLVGPAMAKGMPAAAINTLLIDATGRLWFSAQHKLHSWHPADGQVNAFENSDGLTNGNAYIRLSARLKNGHLLFCARDKIYSINPNEIRADLRPAQAKVTALHVNDRNDNYLYTAPADRDFRFAYGQNTLSFEYAALHFADPASNSIRYRLDGIDNDWIEAASPGGVARYPELPHGDYVFRLQAANSDHVWNPEIVSISLRVLPPYWATWWFRLLAGLCFAGLIFLGVRAYFKNQLLRQQRELREQRLRLEKQEAVQEERNRIAAEMHDDMGSGLAKMRFMSERVRAGDDAALIRQSLDKIALQANQLVENMGDIVWAMNSRFDTLPNLLSYTRRYAVEYLLELDIGCHCSSLESVPAYAVSGRIRRNIFLVIKEILHNIVKHARAKEVDIRFGWDEHELRIAICDNGIGFQRSDREDGNGLHNMRKRMEEIGGYLEIMQLPAGAGLGIVMPLSALLHE